MQSPRDKQAALWKLLKMLITNFIKHTDEKLALAKQRAN
jgi:hypothetical protein